MIGRSVAALAVLFAMPSAHAADPSFDCAKAEGAAEKLICKDDTLAGLDRETTRLYRLALAGRHMTAARQRELRAYQVGWIKGRNECWKAKDLRGCVLASYAIRIAQLRQGYANARSEDDKGKSLGPFSVVCKGFGAGIGATFVNVEPTFVVLQWRNQSHVLTRTRSGSGARYAEAVPGGEMVFWNKGDTALFQRPRQAKLQCKVEEIG